MVESKKEGKEATATKPQQESSSENLANRLAAAAEAGAGLDSENITQEEKDKKQE